MGKGTLYIVGTPIGNLSDISPRALKVLQEVDFIAAEDTRRTSNLLNKYEIKKQLESYHNFNKEFKGGVIVEKILDGMNVALVSDAGMPCISDPGAEIVALCAQNDITVVIIPGPCAAVSALSGSGLDTSKFVFEGFMPSSGKERKDRLQFLQKESRTIIFYEAPHRIKKILNDFVKNEWPDRRIVFARELTKLHEEFIRTTVVEAVKFYEENDPRGEYVIILEGDFEYKKRCPDTENNLFDSAKQELEMARLIDKLLRDGNSTKDISVHISKTYSMPKKEAYNLVQKQKDMTCK